MSFTLKPVVGENFFNRDSLVSEMVGVLSDKGNNTGFALYGKRRVGKTSVFKQVFLKLQGNKEIVPVYFSLWDLVEDSVFEFSRKLSQAILEAYSSRIGLSVKAVQLASLPVDLLKDFLNRLEVNLKLKQDVELMVRLGSEKNVDYDTVLEKVFSLAEGLAKETNTRCVLLIDEFPSVMDLKNGKKLGLNIVKKIRTIDEDLKLIVLNIAGSVRKTMSLVVLDEVSPFYKQLFVREVMPLEKKFVVELIVSNLKKKISGDALEKIFSESRGLPFYVHILGKGLQLRKEKSISSELVSEEITFFLQEEGNLLFQKDFNILSSREKVISVVIACSKVRTLTEISKKANLLPSQTSWFLNSLQEKSVLEKTGVEYFFEDPFFEKWLERKQL